jgi:hypothetical protein
MNDPLAQLKDIHLPPAVSWWPPAPGWWLLGLVMLGGVAWAVVRLRRRTTMPNLRREALAALEQAEADWRSHQDGSRLAAELSTLLRRVAISLYPGTDVAGMTGVDWLRWLDERLGGHDFEKGSGRLLLEAGYRPTADIDDPEALIALTRRWLEKVTKEAGRA